MRKFFLKSVVKATLPVVLVVSMLSGIMNAQVGLCSNRAEQLGSAVAVGSPVLNTNFAEDSWNPYELECFGVYLSNFVEPLTQTYKESFTSGGSGLYALEMSTRNDPVNNRTLKGLLDVAIGYQFNHTSALYIAQFDENGTIKLGDDEETKVNATLMSFYGFSCIEDIDLTSGDFTYYDQTEVLGLFQGLASSDIYLKASRQTVFYKEVEGNKKVMLDTTNAFDVDALNALLAYEFNTNGEAFSEQFWSLLNEPLAVDSFGNIVLASSGYMVFPACLNSHSTKDGTINYVNRYMMNAYTTGGTAQLTTDWQTGDSYSEGVRGPVYLSVTNELGYGGYPVNYSSSAATGMFYAQSCDLLVNESGYTKSITMAAGGGLPGLVGKGDYIRFYEVQGIGAPPAAKYNALYNLMTGDFIMGSQQDMLRFANPINGSLLTHGGWSNADENAVYNGFDSTVLSFKPSLYLIINANAMENAGACIQLQRMSGFTPAAHVFNEIYWPGSDEIHNTLFNTSSSWRIISSQLWASTNSAQVANDAGAFRSAEAKQAYINGLSHAVYDFSHGEDSQTYGSSQSYGPFASMGLSFISEVANPSAGRNGNYKSFYELTGMPSGTYDVKIKGSGSTKLDVAWGTLQEVKVDKSNDPDYLTPQQNFYKIYALSGDSAIYGMGQLFTGSNTAGKFEGMAAYIYVTYLNYYMIGREADQYGVKTATSDFDPMFFDSNILFNDFASMGISAPSNEEQENAARTRMMLLLDPEKGADYRREIVTTTLTKFCSDSYNKMTGKQFGSSASSALCLQEISENPFTGWLVDHEVVVILVFTFIAMILAAWIAVSKGKGLFWAVCQIAVGIVGVVMIPFILNAGVRVANFASQKIYSANADVWWLADAVENRYAELGLNDVYNENAEAYDKMGLSREQMANIVLGSSSYQSITFSQDISNKQVMPLSGLYAHLSQYPSAAWILPVLLDQTTVEDEETGGYTIRVGAFKKLSELETLYWGYFPEAIGDTPTWLNASAGNTVSGSATGLGYTDYGKVGTDGNTWYYGSISNLIPPMTPLHHSTELTTGLSSPAYNGFMSSDVWLYKGDASDKVHLIESTAASTCYTATVTWNSIGKAGNTFHPHTLTDENDKYDWYLKGTESPLTYFYCVAQDTFYGFNTAQTIDALIGTTEYYGEGQNDYYNLNFLQATQGGTYNVNGSTTSLAADHTWSSDAVGTDFSRDILDLEYFYRIYAPLMYQQAIKTGGSQIGLDELNADVNKDVVGTFGAQLIKETDWDYPIYENNYASWMFNCNWAIKLYENPQNIKLQTVRDSAGNSYTVCPINPYTYPDSRPFVTCRAMMECYGLDEGDLSTIELANVQANDDAMLEIIKTINVYTNAPATLDVNSFKDLVAVKCLSAYVNNVNQTALANSKYRIIPNGFEFDGICFDTVFSQMVYNTNRKANAYTVEDAVEGYIADAGPIMALFLTATAALGAVVIPWVLRFGLALLYVVNLWAALSAVIESLEQKASILLASVVNTASFTIRTVILFVVQGFLMSLGGVGVIVEKNAIAFRGSTTMLIFTLLVFYILYTISIIEFFTRTVQNGNDMGAAYLRENFERSRNEGLLKFAQHRFAQSWGGKVLNSMSRGMLGNAPKTSATGSGTTTPATGTGDTSTSGTGGGNGGGGSVASNEGGNTIDKAKARANTSLDQAAERTHAKGKDNPAGGSYIQESMDKGKKVDTRSDAFMTQAFGDSKESGTRNWDAGVELVKKEAKASEASKEKPKEEKPKGDGPKTKI